MTPSKSLKKRIGIPQILFIVTNIILEPHPFDGSGRKTCRIILHKSLEAYAKMDWNLFWGLFKGGPYPVLRPFEGI